MEQFNKNPGIVIEQDADAVLLKFKRKMLGLLCDEHILPINPTYTIAVTKNAS